MLIQAMINKTIISNKRNRKISLQLKFKKQKDQKQVDDTLMKYLTEHQGYNLIQFGIVLTLFNKFHLKLKFLSVLQIFFKGSNIVGSKFKIDKLICEGDGNGVNNVKKLLFQIKKEKLNFNFIKMVLLFVLVIQCQKIQIQLNEQLIQLTLKIKYNLVQFGWQNYFMFLK
ncbi:unnamed protein product [Paramecium pentaurelia]|uniref:Uncharacterized protein n=1 Tax=Paramecium pentaurelia TaxID=43138 RepID=A0A8S1T0M8_9CILI|nr:unnamed protein product [Paramecium pentaurelia]